MKVAILHDYLNQFGGAERVLLALLEIFREAHLYTLLYDEEKTFGLFRKHIQKTSFLDHPWLRKNHRLFIPFMPIAASLLRAKEPYDLVISSTAGYSKGFGVKGKYHVSYCHSPLRYAWEIDYLKELPLSPRVFSRNIAYPIANWLKSWDRKSAANVNLFIANSHFIAQKIKAYYGREAEVVYPPIDLQVFYREPKVTKHEQLYFLMVGRLLYYKRFDLGIQAFNRLKKPLKIVGSGPEGRKLKALANPQYIEFLDNVSDTELRRLYNNAQALVFPQIEDFGLTAAEAQVCGLPVLAFNQGGAKEILENRKTGLFFQDQTPEALMRGVQEFKKLKLDRKYIAKTATIFSKEKFKNQIKKIIYQNGFNI